MLDAGRGDRRKLQGVAGAGAVAGSRCRRGDRRRGDRARRRPAGRRSAISKAVRRGVRDRPDDPYILQNAPCAVWVVREPMNEETIVKIVIVGCGRVGASAAELWDAAGHEVIVLDISTRAFERLPIDLRRDRRPRRRHGRGRPAPRRHGGRRRLPRPDRGRQPERHGGTARGRGIRGRARHRQDQRPGARRRVRRARHRHPVSDGPDGRRRERVPRVPAIRLAGHARPSGHHPGGDHHADPPIIRRQRDAFDAAAPCRPRPSASMEA